MYNFNGQIAKDVQISVNKNRAFLYGDAVFETIRINKNQILFLEDHYFRLMASMRILRMEIPMFFTMEFLEEEIKKLVENCIFSISYRIRVTVYRDAEGFYAPKTNNVSYLIQAEPLKFDYYTINSEGYEVELFKDFTVTPQLLSTLKSTNKMVQITAGIFANENGYDNCLLLNTDKNITEATNSNLFLVSGNTIITPPLADGCLNGIMRKHVLRLLKKSEQFNVEEKSISPFDLQKADELFLTNVVTGIQSITKYRKKTYTTNTAATLVVMLNESLN